MTPIFCYLRAWRWRGPKAQLFAGARLVGYLAMRCPIANVREMLARHGVESQRRRGLPHEVLIYFVLAMVLYRNVACEEVLRLVIKGLRPLLGEERGWRRAQPARAPFLRRGSLLFDIDRERAKGLLKKCRCDREQVPSDGRTRL